MNEENTYDQIVTSIVGDDRSQNARTGFYVATGVDADRYANALQISRRTGIPVNSVLSNPDEAKRQDAVSSVNFDDIASHTPATARLMGNYEAAKLAHDDLDNMGLLETTVNSFRRGGLLYVPNILQSEC